jgi:hypothetical protein
MQNMPFLLVVDVLFLSVSYGIVANRYGRMLVYYLSLLGLINSNVWFLIVCECAPKHAHMRSI